MTTLMQICRRQHCLRRRRGRRRRRCLRGEYTPVSPGLLFIVSGSLRSIPHITVHTVTNHFSRSAGTIKFMAT